MLLQEMLKKYSRQLSDLELDIRHSLARGHDKHVLLSKLRRKKILLHYMQRCRKKIDVILHKKYAVEQLNITAMQIDAMKDTADVFRTFTNKHNIEKIEELQDTMEDLQGQIMDINESLGTEQLIFDDDELEKELNDLNYEAATVAIATFPDVAQPQSQVVPMDKEKILILN